MVIAMIESAYGHQPPDVVVSDQYFNTAMGTAALTEITDGDETPPAGVRALKQHDRRRQHCLWASALQNNSTSLYNTAFGVAALYLNTTGNANTASGAAALFSNSTGYYNTASGASALYNNDGQQQHRLGIQRALCQ